MKFTKIIFLFIIIGLIGCNKDEPVENPPEEKPEKIEEGDELPPEVLAYVDTIPSILPDFSEYILPNGRSIEEFMREYDGVWFDAHYRSDPYANFTPFERKNILIGRFTTQARFLANRNNFQIPFEGANKPAQFGLAYSYGGKDYTIRQAPPAGSCTEEVYGLDCSGYLYHLFEEAELNFIVGNADMQRQTTNIKNALSTFSSLDILNVQNLGEISTSQFQTGDIVYWSKLNGSNASHIGMVIQKSDGSLAVFQSNGSSYSNCQSNYGTSRGPRALSLTSNYWFGTGSDWEIIRIQAPTSNGGGQVDCSDFEYYCGSGWSGHGGAMTYPLTFTTATPCGGHPPYEYTVDSYNGGWISNNVWIINQPGTYTFKARDSEGCYDSYQVTFP